VAFNFGHVLLVLLILLAFYVSEWQVALAFLVAVIMVPITYVLSYHMYEVIVKGQEFDSVKIMMGGIFAMLGIPVYYALMMPSYYILKNLGFPIIISFPFVVSVIILILFKILATKPWGFTVFITLAGCGILHSLFILWLISKFKSMG